MIDPSLKAYESVYIEKREKCLTLCTREAECPLLRVKSLAPRFSRGMGIDGAGIKLWIFKFLNDSVKDNSK